MAKWNTFQIKRKIKPVRGRLFCYFKIDGAKWRENNRHRLQRENSLNNVGHHEMRENNDCWSRRALWKMRKIVFRWSFFFCRRNVCSEKADFFFFSFPSKILIAFEMLTTKINLRQWEFFLSFLLSKLPFTIPFIRFSLVVLVTFFRWYVSCGKILEWSFFLMGSQRVDNLRLKIPFK